MQNDSEICGLYNNGTEIDRLEHGLGAVEFYRSKEIICGEHDRPEKYPFFIANAFLLRR